MFLGRVLPEASAGTPVLGSIGTGLPVAGSTGLPVSGSNLLCWLTLACGRIDWLAALWVELTREWSSCSGVERKSCGLVDWVLFPGLRIDRSSGLWVVVRWDWFALLVKLSSGHRIELSCSLDRLLGLRVDWELGCLVDWVGFSGGRIGLACRSEDRMPSGLACQSQG